MWKGQKSHINVSRVYTNFFFIWHFQVALILQENIKFIISLIASTYLS